VPLLVGLGTVVGGVGKLVYDDYQAEQKQKLERQMVESAFAAWQQWQQKQSATKREPYAAASRRPALGALLSLARCEQEALASVLGDESRRQRALV
jgi:hypothetical protein